MELIYAYYQFLSKNTGFFQIIIFTLFIIIFCIRIEEITAKNKDLKDKIYRKTQRSNQKLLFKCCRQILQRNWDNLFSPIRIYLNFVLRRHLLGIISFRISRGSIITSTNQQVSCWKAILCRTIYCRAIQFFILIKNIHVFMWFAHSAWQIFHKCCT